MAKSANLPSSDPSVETPSVKEQLLHEFEISQEVTPLPENEHVHTVREEAIEWFEKLGIPSTKDEYYKYTAVDRELKKGYAQHFSPIKTSVTEKDVNAVLGGNVEGHTLVLVNGTFSEELSTVGELPKGAVIEELMDAADQYPQLFEEHYAQHADYTKESFIALNTAFARQGVFVYVPSNTIIEEPIHVVHLNDPEEPILVQPRNLFVVGQSSQVSFVESFQSAGGERTFSNTLTEMVVGENAQATHYLIQDEKQASAQLSTRQIYQKQDSTARSFTFTLEGGFVRNNLNFVQDGTNCESHLIGLYLPDGKDHVDNHTLVDHASPDCFSNELFRGIMDDHSKAVFNGRVLVRKYSQRINAYQSNKNILLTKNASIDTKPELEIYADDVECSHGATIGQLDHEALFYLRSRGIPERKARTLLLFAFAGDVVDEIAVEPLREYMQQEVNRRLE